MKTEAPPLIVPAGTSRIIRAFGDELHLHLGGAETGGRFAMFTVVTQPGGGPPPHIHRDEDEWFHVLEGRVEFFHEGAWTEVPAGSSIFMPRNSFHTFRNIGDVPLKQLIHTSPAGFEVFFQRCEEVFAKGGPPDMDTLIQIAGEHGLSFPSV
jgi:quercetin dioxygenase-like cupin family protein